MRPPKDKWRLAQEAIDALLVLSVHTLKQSNSAEQIAALVKAQDAVVAFRDHVHSSEECEMG